MGLSLSIFDQPVKTDPRSPEPGALELAECFNLVFDDPSSAGYCMTRVETGASEPYYRAWQRSPCEREITPAILYSRDDYPASVLHEAAHWTRAGLARRCIDDFGYWYHPEGRTESEQQAFYEVERIPQALECLFSRAAGLSFKPSYDDFSQEPASARARADFARSVEATVSSMLSGGTKIPHRARLFINALAERRR